VLHQLRVDVVSDKGKVLNKRDQVSIKETNVSEPLMKCRKSRNDVKTRGLLLTWDKHEMNLLTAHAASGIKVA
jgi:hypothetical protein